MKNGKAQRTLKSFRTKPKRFFELAKKRGLRSALWHTRRYFQSNFAFATSTGSADKKIVFKDFKPLQDSYKPYKSLRVGVILDEFSMMAWKEEFNVVPLAPQRLREQILPKDSVRGLDLILVESAWAGNSGKWQFKLTGPNGPAEEVRELVALAKGMQVPTVFWNKEDPPHFEEFLECAKLFDAVLTSDANLVPAYQEALRTDRVSAMGFAAQTTLHNPTLQGRKGRPGDIAFAGMYFRHKFAERRRQMDLLLTAASRVAEEGRGDLMIFSRHGATDPNYRFPDKFKSFVAEELPYKKMLSAYRNFKVILNVNTVTDSPTMCSRRVFEAIASGAAVVTTPSAAIRQYFEEGEVFVVDDAEQAYFLLRALLRSKELRDRVIHRGQRVIWENHTYTHRARTVLDAAGIDRTGFSDGLPEVTVITSTNRPHNIDHLIAQVARQQGADVSFQLLLHGVEVDLDRIRQKLSDAGLDQATVHQAPREWSLGRCLNSLIGHSETEFIAKFDDDDFYGPNYLRDQINSLRMSGADIVGKQSNYVWMESTQTLALKYPSREHEFTDFVAGPTLVFRRIVSERIRFQDRTLGEDSAFLREAIEAGMKIYSADRFNFVQVRNASTHTWNVSELEILANSEVTLFGGVEQHINI